MVATDGRRRRICGLVGAVLVAAPAIAACGSEGGTLINVYYAPEQHFQQVIDDCNAEAGGRYEIVYRTLPRGADGQREQMVRRLAAGDTALDILGLDVTWVPEFAEAGWLAKWTGDDRAEAERGVLEGPLTTARWDGKLYAATKNTNVQLLWYDERITPNPPRTWDTMMEMARDLRSRGQPYEIWFTGAQYEGLVVQYNSIVESAGGQILSDDGRSVVMDAGAVRGLEILDRVASSGLTDPSVSNAQEQQVQQAFEAAGSDAAFQLNWPYIYAAIQTGGRTRHAEPSHHRRLQPRAVRRRRPGSAILPGSRAVKCRALFTGTSGSRSPCVMKIGGAHDHRVGVR